MLNIRARYGHRFLVLALVALIAIPALLIGVNYSVRSIFADAATRVEEVNHTNELRVQLGILVILLQGVESGSRGYAQTGDPQFLKPYLDARPRIGRALDRLEAFTPGNPWLGRYFPSLRKNSENRVQRSDLIVDLMRKGQRNEASVLISQGAGLRVMQAVKDDAAKIDRQAAAILQQSGEKVHAERLRVRIKMVALETVLILLIVVATLLALRTLRARKAALIRLENSDARQRAIFANARDGMIMLNESGTIETVNPAAAAMFGYQQDDLTRCDIGMLFQIAPDRGQTETFLKRLKNNGDIRGLLQEFWSRRRDSSTFPVEVAVSPVPLPDGMRYLAVTRDVSERKRLEEMKSEFVSTVSHELRTPLTSIAGSLGLLRGTMSAQMPDGANHLIAIAHKNSERLIRLINDILDVEKIESGKMTFAIAPLELASFLRDILETSQGFAHTHNVRLELREPPHGATVLADPDRLAQVMSNLISNAIKFSPAGDVVTISVAPLDWRFRISVIDRGPGIPDSFRDNIFHKFAQADASDSRQKGGTGLGLAIVKEITERLGGRISYENRAEGGAIFHLDLPATPPDPQSLSELALSIKPEDANLPTILHLEDDRDMLQIVAEAFKGAANVHSIANVEDAVVAIRRRRFDAAILDIAMQDGSGLDVAPLLSQTHPRTPIIVFTAQEFGLDAVDGVDAVLTKSRCSLPALVETVVAAATNTKGSPV